MLLHAQDHVIGVADVIRAVGTAQDVDVKRAHASGVDLGNCPEHPCPFSLCLPKACPSQRPGFDKLSPNGEW
nr:hypothetical protein [uncultured Acidovorax sp.]